MGCQDGHRREGGVVEEEQARDIAEAEVEGGGEEERESRARCGDPREFAAPGHGPAPFVEPEVEGAHAPEDEGEEGNHPVEIATILQLEPEGQGCPQVFGQGQRCEDAEHIQG